jgi:hypothetical protein
MVEDRPKIVSLEEQVALQLGDQIVEEWNPFSYLIKDEDDEEFIFLGRPIKDLPKYTKEEIDHIFLIQAPLRKLNQKLKVLIISLLLKYS